MASPSRALSGQRKLAKFISNIHEEQAAEHNISFTPLKQALAFDESKVETTKQPRGIHSGTGSPRELRVLRKYLSNQDISADDVVVRGNQIPTVPLGLV